MTWVPEACTLPTPQRPLRVAEFDALFAQAVRAPERAGASVLRLYLPPGESVVSRLRDLVARETSCCSFFSFELHPSATGTVLEARVPESRTAVLDAMQERVEAVRLSGGRG
jgi:hypothetical protein